MKSWWIQYKGFHPWARKFEARVKLAVLLYVILIIVQSIFTYFQMGGLRGQFMNGREEATCTRVSWENGNSNFDCGGYYSTIVEKREAMQDANGCFLMGRWSLDTGKPDVAYSYLAGPVCWKPFPFGSLIDVSFGSAFNSP
jgi:hypothetical protein